MSKTIFVYEHWRSDKDVCFYVGIGTDRRVAKRVREHNLLHCRILEKLKRNGARHETRIIAKVCSWSEACELERKLIAKYGRRDLGRGPLVNLTDGGEGALGIIRLAGARAKISAANLGRKHSPEARAKMAISSFKRWSNPEMREKIIMAMRGHKLSQETKDKMSASAKKRVYSQEEREKQSRSATGRRASPQTRAKLSEAQRKRYRSPEERAKSSDALRKRLASPEARKKLSEAQTKVWADRKIARQS